MPEIILPGTYITVRDEGLITAGRVSTGNIGIVGTANKGPINEVKIIGSFTEARELFGDMDDIPSGGSGELTLVRAIQQIYNNGGRAVYAVRTAAKAGTTEAPSSATLVLKDTANSPADLLRLTASSQGTWGNDITAKVSIPVGELTGTRLIELSDGVIKERFQAANVTDLAAAVTKGSRLASAAIINTAGTRELAETPSPLPKLSGGKNGEKAIDTDYIQSLALLEQDIINIVLLAGQSNTAAGMNVALQGHINVTAENKRERIALIGCNGTIDEDTISKHDLSSDRIIFVAPGLRVGTNLMSGAYTAAAVAGLLSALPVQTSPTNKPIAIGGLNVEFSSSKLEKLVQKNVLVVEKREGFRVVKGITTAGQSSAWHQITTRRIVDYAIYGVRSACNAYIGKLNNERVRGAMKATLDAFLTRMVEDEALISYELEVSATRAQEIAGECAVTMTIRPTFSIDFVRVTMYLG